MLSMRRRLYFTLLYRTDGLDTLYNVKHTMNRRSDGCHNDETWWSTPSWRALWIASKLTPLIRGMNKRRSFRAPIDRQTQRYYGYSAIAEIIATMVMLRAPPPPPWCQRSSGRLPPLAPACCCSCCNILLLKTRCSSFIYWRPRWWCQRTL